MVDTTKFQGVEVMSVVQSLRPAGEGWMQVQDPRTPQFLAESITATAWLNTEYGFFVISAVEKVHEPDGIDRGPEYHLSFSRQTGAGPARVTSNEANWLLKAFGLEGAFEDNHVPHGKVHNFWRTVREDLIGMECICNETEPEIREDKGDYIWRPANDADNR